MAEALNVAHEWRADKASPAAVTPVDPMPINELSKPCTNEDCGKDLK
jgi:hypothetical protein